MLTAEQVAVISQSIKRLKVKQEDIEASKNSTPIRKVTGERGKMFSAMSAAIAEKMCRSCNLDVRNRRTSQYILSTVNGRVAVSVMVSAILGDPVTKNMVIPRSSISVPPGVSEHVLVCAFVSKHSRLREMGGCLNTRLAGWCLASEIGKLAGQSRVNSMINIVTVPVTSLRPMDELKEYLKPKEKENDDEKTMP